MWLYHGTYEMFYKSIKKQGLIVPSAKPDTATVQLDTFINKMAGRNIRGNCIYLSMDKDAMDGFDLFFRISTSRLNTTKLYVADNSVLDKILCYWGTSDAQRYAKRYMESYLSFKRFIDNKEEYMKLYRPEFLYFDSISVCKK